MKCISVAKFKTAEVRKNITLGSYDHLSSQVCGCVLLFWFGFFSSICNFYSHISLGKKKPQRESIQKSTISSLTLLLLLCTTYLHFDFFGVSPFQRICEAFVNSAVRAKGCHRTGMFPWDSQPQADSWRQWQDLSYCSCLNLSWGHLTETITNACREMELII